MIKHSLFAISMTLLVGGIALEPAQAAPTTCMFPDTTARAVRLYGAPNGQPSPCALNVCRPHNWYTSRVVPNTNPGMPSPAVTIYQASPGAWSGLPACPTWTNTSTWAP